MNIATWKQGQGARYSKTLAKILLMVMNMSLMIAMK